ncbi:MAG: TRAP transporter small permease [Spirochaetales bacterium]
MWKWLQDSADALRKLTLGFSSVILGMQILLVSYVVAGRYLFGQTPRWGEELALLCMVWFSLLSAVIAARDGKHIRIRVVFDRLPVGLQKVMRVVFVVFSQVFNLVLFVFGLRLAEVTSRSVLPGSGLSRSWLYIPLAVAGGLLFITMSLSIQAAYPVTNNKGEHTGD